MTSRIFNAVLQNQEISDTNRNWSQLASLETYYIRSHDPIINHALKVSNELLIFNFEGALSGVKQFLVSESPLKMMKNAFYFTLKAFFVLKILKFLS